LRRERRGGEDAVERGHRKSRRHVYKASNLWREGKTPLMT